MPEFNPDWAIPPYETILDCYVDQGKTVGEAHDNIKRLLGIPDESLSKLMTGDLHLSDEMCVKLSTAFRASEQFWKNREAQYRVRRLRIEMVQDRLQQIEKKLKEKEAIDLVYETEDWLKAQDFMTVELFIRKMEERVQHLPAVLPISLLTVTLPWAQEDQIRESRWDLYDALYNHLLETRGKEQASDALGNLRS